MSCLSAVLFTVTVLARNIFSQPVVPEFLCSLLGSRHVKDYIIMPLVSRAHVKALYCRAVCSAYFACRILSLL